VPVEHYQRPPVIQVPVEPASFQLPQVAEAPYQKPPWPLAMASPQAQARTPPFPQGMSPWQGRGQDPLQAIRQEPLQFQQQRFSPASARGASTPPNFPRVPSYGSLTARPGLSSPTFKRDAPLPRTSSFLVPKGSLGPHRAERDGGNFFRALDLNHDGVVSDDEVQRFVGMRNQQQLQQQQQQKQHLQHVQHMGQGHQPVQGGMGPNFYGPPGACHNGYTSPGGYGMRRGLSFSEASSASEDCCTRD